MIQRDGIWFPDEDQAFHTFHLKERDRDIPFFLSMVKGRDRVIQAGGAMGLYPLALADHFQHVVTFEPDPGNWECLKANLYARDCLYRITPIRAGLGERCGRGAMEKPNPENMGANRVVPGDGPIQLYNIDTMVEFGPTWGKIDAIWLDIEGMELAALKGAERTIREHSPLVVCEENGNGSRYGVGETDIEDYLTTLGYEREAGVGRDRYYRRVG